MNLKYYLYNVFRTTSRPRIIPCDTPVLLISQIQRSGGTLVSQLFDDHSQLFVHPHEAHWGRPKKWDWPEDDPVVSRDYKYHWEALYSSFVDKGIERGYSKGEFSNTLPFVFDRLLQIKIFRERVESGLKSQRQVFDSYMTSFFNAWTDYQNLYRTPKKYTVAFTPRVSMYPRYVDRFFRDYPDGYMMSVVRDPLSWLASAKKHARSQRDMQDKSTENLVGFWKQSVDAVLENKRNHPERFIVALFSDLVQNTEGLMRAISDTIGIPYEDTLTRPTFNGLSIAANTSHEELKDKPGIITSTLDIYKKTLSAEEIADVESRFLSVYDEVGPKSVLQPA